MSETLENIKRKAYVQRIRASKMDDSVRVPTGAVPQLLGLKGIRAVVFDVYGTLISSGVGDISLAAQSSRDASLRASLIDHGFYSLKPVETMRSTNFCTQLFVSTKPVAEQKVSIIQKLKYAKSGGT